MQRQSARRKIAGNTPVFPLTIFYDGACRVCATQMRHYRQKSHGGRLLFVDISDPGFDPERFGSSRQNFMAQMHVIDGAGVVYRGVDAFPVIWQAFPGFRYRLLARLIGLPGIRSLARSGYVLFARFRHYLPGRAVACDADTCHPENRR